MDTTYWMKNRKVGYMLIKVLEKLYNRSIENTLFWHSFFTKKILQIYPYFICHYIFNKIILENIECADLWKSSKPYEADYPHILQQLNHVKKDLEKAISDIDKDSSPVYKFNRRNDYTEYYWKSVLDYLCRRIN